MQHYLGRIIMQNTKKSQGATRDVLLLSQQEKEAIWDGFSFLPIPLHSSKPQTESRLYSQAHAMLTEGALWHSPPALDTKSPAGHTVTEHRSLLFLGGARASSAVLSCVVFFCCSLNHTEACVHRASCYTIRSLLRKMKNIKKKQCHDEIHDFVC